MKSINLRLLKILTQSIVLIFGMSYQSSFAKTLHIPIDQPILEVKFRCAEATECSVLPEENVVFLEKNDEYIDNQEKRVIVESPGFLVTKEMQTNKATAHSDDIVGKHIEANLSMDLTSSSAKIKFVKLQDTLVSPDENFYSCDDGKNYVLDDASIEMSDIFDDKNLFDGLTSNLNCGCFWAPKSVLVSLKPIEPNPDSVTAILLPPTSNPPTTIFTQPPNNPFNPVLPNPCFFCGPGNPGNPNPPLEPPIAAVPIGGEELGLFGFLNPFLLWKVYIAE